MLGERGTAQTCDVQAGSLRDIYQGLEGERAGAKLAGTSLREVCCDPLAGKYIVGTAEDGDSVRGHVKRRK